MLTPKIIPVPTGGHTQNLSIVEIGRGMPFLFLHGWGTNRSTFYPLMERLNSFGRLIALDFPGFGDSPPPPETWGTGEYAECLFALIASLGLPPCWAVAHSFGGRVALRLAHAHPEALQGLVLIASAGLRRKPPLRRRLRVSVIRSLARAAAYLPSPVGPSIHDALYRRIASRDYLEAGDLRSTFVRVVNEDLSPLLPAISLPVLLIYGSDDRETPPWIGRRFAELLSASEYVELPGFDHLSILDRGSHQVEHHVRRFHDRYMKNEMRQPQNENEGKNA